MSERADLLYKTHLSASAAYRTVRGAPPCPNLAGGDVCLLPTRSPAQLNAEEYAHQVDEQLKLNCRREIFLLLFLLLLLPPTVTQQRYQRRRSSFFWEDQEIIVETDHGTCSALPL